MEESSNESILKKLNEKQHPRAQRRFDTLARLLETNMTCAAVCLIDKILYITTNDIYANFSGQLKPKPKAPNTQGFKFLKMASARFLSAEFQQKDLYTESDREIILANFKGKSATYYKGQQDVPSLKDEEIDGIIKYLLDAESTQDFMTSKTLAFFEKFLISDVNSDKEKFAKPKKSQTFRKILDVQRTFQRLWRDVRDYRKFKEMVLRGDVEIDACKILCVGQKDEHAEMRLLGFLLNEPGIFTVQKDNTLGLEKPLYVGISKLCCPYCVGTLNEFNNLLTLTEKATQPLTFQVGDDSQVDEDALLSSSSLLSASEYALEDELLRNDILLDTRGSHPLRFKWIFPAFARHPIVKGDWPCVELQKWSDRPDKLTEKCVYYVKKGTHQLYRCGVSSPKSSITFTGKGNNRRFSVSPCSAEISIAKEHFFEKKGAVYVNSSDTQKAVESYYCSGFRSQVVTLTLNDDGHTLNSVCALLEESDASVQVKTCLQACNFSKLLRDTCQTVSEHVIELKGEVKMVASTSTSSVGQVSVKKGQKEEEVIVGGAGKVPNIIVSDWEESEYAEEGSSRDSSRRSGSDSTVESKNVEDDDSDNSPSF